tara:strand:+ start:56 stop:238 length:183 start_codon:yes stop_codon:yes gene_type:complete
MLTRKGTRIEKAKLKISKLKFESSITPLNTQKNQITVDNTPETKPYRNRREKSFPADNTS